MTSKSQVKKYQGLVMRIDGQVVTVMTNSGLFLKTAYQGHEVIGDEIEFLASLEPVKPSKWGVPKWAHSKTFARALVASLLLFTATGVSWAYPVGQIYVDVNPSLGLSYNIYERVIGVKSFNEDGKVIQSDLDVYGKSIKDSVEKTMLLINDLGYVKDNESPVLIGYSESKESVKAATASALTTVVEKVEKPLSIAEVSVSAEEVSSAKTKETSPIKEALKTKTATPIDNKVLNAAQRRLLEEQKKLEELKKKNESLTQKIETAANVAQPKPKVEQAMKEKQAVVQKQIEATQKSVTAITQKIESIEEESIDLESKQEFVAATPLEKLTQVKNAHAKLVALRKKIIQSGLATEADQNRLKQVSAKILQLERLMEKINVKNNEKPTEKPIENPSEKKQPRPKKNTDKKS